MALKDKLPVSYLLFTNRGRIDRITYWTGSLFIWSAFYVLFQLLNYLISPVASWIIYPLLFWALLSTSTKRLHDSNLSGKWLVVILIPGFGIFILLYLLGFKRGSKLTNRYGQSPGIAADYYVNDAGKQIMHLNTSEKIINEITQLHPIIVKEVVAPTSITDLQNVIKQTETHLSIGGGRFSMGGQTASPGSTHIDMRKLNKIIDFNKDKKTIKVEAGIRWCDIQAFIDEHDLSVKIMQTYANFTVGGSLSVNCHGRYIGQGAVILSVKSIDIILANGNLVTCSENEKSELFFACIGGYNAIAVIASVEFELAHNLPVKRVFKTMSTSNYLPYFFNEIKNNQQVVFHNADLYPPKFKLARAVSWIETEEKPTVKTKLMPLSEAYPIERYFINAFSKNNFGKWRRQFILDPILYSFKKIHWRNYEAGYDVAELEPKSRTENTFVLQEYFIPVAQFDEFTRQMAEIFQRYKVNVINVSVRHAEKDRGSLLAWSREEVFAFVVWYNQLTTDVEKNKVAVWTRELIDLAIKLNGAYYLPYQAHATESQFHLAYPNANKLMALKKQLDPTFKFRNVLWDKYYKPNVL